MRSPVGADVLSMVSAMPFIAEEELLTRMSKATSQAWLHRCRHAALVQVPHPRPAL